MKFYVEVEMDYMEGDAGREFEHQVQQKIVDRIQADMQKRIEGNVANVINREIEAFVTQILIDFMDKEVKITDCYGKVKETYADVDELIKAKLNKFMEEPVDNYGKPYTGCSTSQSTRYSYMVNGMLKTALDKFKERMTKEFGRKIEEDISEAKEQIITDAFAKSKDFQALLAVKKD